jgi:signal transduction histidine kinase
VETVTQWRSQALRGRLGDAGLAALCLLLVQIAVWTGTVRGPDLWNSALLTLVTVPIAVKTAAPLLATVSACAALVLQVALFGATETAGLTIAVVALAYGVAAHAEGRALVAGLGILVATGLFHEARDRDIHTFVDALFVPIVIAVAAILGFAVAQVRARAELAERHARMAEAAQGTAALLAAGQERERIARELHDVLAHSVSVMVVQAEAAEELLDRSPESARGPVTAVQRTGREALAELRMLLGAVRSDEDAGLAPQPGIAQVPDLVEAAVEAGQSVDFQITGDLAGATPAVGATVYRVVQEALTNARKHAPGARCDVVVTHTPGLITIDVVNGPGSLRPDEAAGGGHGLLGMRERVTLCGGSLQHGAQDDGGFRVRAELPTEDR